MNPFLSECTSYCPFLIGMFRIVLEATLTLAQKSRQPEVIEYTRFVTNIYAAYP